MNHFNTGSKVAEVFKNESKLNNDSFNLLFRCQDLL